MRAFPVILPSGACYWTVLDEDLAVVAVADESCVRFVSVGTAAESTTKSTRIRLRCSCGGVPGLGRTGGSAREQITAVFDVVGSAGPSRFECQRVVGGWLSGPGRAVSRSGAAADQRGVDRGAGDGGACGEVSGRRDGNLLSVLYEVADDRDLPP